MREGLRYRLLLVYPLRMQHNSLPVGVQTLATYMLALLNPLCLWFTRIVVDPTALIASKAEAAAAAAEDAGDAATSAAAGDQMAYSQVYTQVQTIRVLQGDQFWGVMALGLCAVVILQAYAVVAAVGGDESAGMLRVSGRRP